MTKFYGTPSSIIYRLQRIKLIKIKVTSAEFFFWDCQLRYPLCKSLTDVSLTRTISIWFGFYFHVIYFSLICTLISVQGGRELPTATGNLFLTECWTLLTIFTRQSIIDVWQGLECVSERSRCCLNSLYTSNCSVKSWEITHVVLWSSFVHVLWFLKDILCKSLIFQAKFGGLIHVLQTFKHPVKSLEFLFILLCLILMGRGVY